MARAYRAVILPRRGNPAADGGLMKLKKDDYVVDNSISFAIPQYVILDGVPMKVTAICSSFSHVSNT